MRVAILAQGGNSGAHGTRGESGPSHARLAAIGLIIGAAVAMTTAVAAEPKPEPGERLTVARVTVDDLKAVFATVESVRTIYARARIGGTITGLGVLEGDLVAAGQVVATVTDPKLPMQVTALEARLRSLEAQRHQAETELDRARALRAGGTVPQQRLDDAQTAVDVLHAQIAAMTAERAVAAQQLRDGEVLAPAAGRVLKVLAVDGGVVMPGEPLATLATAGYVLRLRLPERHARFIAAGDPVLVGERGLADAGSPGAPPRPEAALRQPASPPAGPPKPAGAPAAAAAAPALRSGRVTLVYPELASGLVVADAEVAGLGDFFVGERVRVLVATGRRTAIVIPPAFLTRRFGVEFVRLAGGAEVPVQSGAALPALPHPTALARPPGGRDKTAQGDEAGWDGDGIEILSGLHAGDVIVRPDGTRASPEAGR